MRNIRDPRQTALYDVWEQVLAPGTYEKLKRDWPGVFREVILHLMPVELVAEHFDPKMGRPTKELYSMAGLLLIAEFHDWTPAEAARAYVFYNDVQYALNLQPAHQTLSERTVERYQKIFIENDIAAEVMMRITCGIVEELELDISRQRTDSTHVYSDMAIFGRTRLMGVTIKRFLTQLKRHNCEEYEALPEELKARYRVSEGRLFGDVAPDREARGALRQTVAQDMQLLIERFGDDPSMQGRRTYQDMLQVFTEQCEVMDEAVKVKAHPGGDVMQNPSDPDATRDGHKGPGHQSQVSETCSPDNDVQLITCALPQTAVTADAPSLPDVLDGLEAHDLLPDIMWTDTSYGSDDNVQDAAERGVDLQSPVSGKKKDEDPYGLSVDDFVVDEETEQVQRCPAGVEPEESARDEQTGVTRTRMPAETCRQCEFCEQCPVEFSRGRGVLKHSGKQRRLAARRREQDTEAFREAYRIRSGGESLFSGAKGKLGLDRLRVRGSPAVSYKILMKFAGWNVLRAAASEKLREKLSKKEQKRAESGRNTATCPRDAIRMTATAWVIWYFQRLHSKNRAPKRSPRIRSHSAPALRNVAA